MSTVTGRIRIWPQGTNYDNQLLQIYLLVGKEKHCFNGYVKENERKEIEEILKPHMLNITVTQEQNWNLRKPSFEEFNSWCNSKKLTAIKHTTLFITGFKLSLINNK